MPCTAYNHIIKHIIEEELYIKYRSGSFSRKEYQNAIDTGSLDKPKELNEDQFNLSARFPLDGEVFVDEALSSLKAHGIIKSTDYNKKAFSCHCELVYSKFSHDKYYTYIFPEEERLLFSLAYIIKPKSVVFLGSYYGYWGSWVLPLLSGETEITMIDIDKHALELSRDNFESLGYKNVKYINDDAISYMKNTDNVYDMVVLDAEGPKDTGPVGLRDKAIYYPMVESVSARMAKGAILVAHNILLSNISEGKYFERKIKDNLSQLSNYLKYIEANFDLSMSFNSTEGVGVYRK